MPFSAARQWVGLGIETVRGTAVAPTLFVPAKSPSWVPVITELDDVGVRGSMVDKYDQIAGLRHDTFDFSCDVFADTFPAFVRACLGSTDTMTGSGPFVHTLGLLNTTDGQPPSYTISYFDGMEMWQLPAGQLDQLDVKFNATALLELTPKFLSNPAATASAASPSFSTVEAAPSWDCVVSLGGSPITKTVDGGITLVRGTKAIEAITGTQLPYRLWAGPLQTSGSLTVVMESDTELNYYINNTKGIPLDVTFTDNSGNLIEFHLSTPAWKSGKKAPNGDYMEVQLAFTGLPNSTDAVAGGVSPIKVTTTNSRSTVY